MDETRIAKLAEWMNESHRIVFFGGAGVSTESGVKDYRSEDGLYNTVKQYGVSPEEILSHDFLYGNPTVFYDFYYHYFLKTSARPNPAHFALAKLEQLGRLKAVVTQNIDGLHQKAGSQAVYELHGTVSRHYCTSCGQAFPTEQVAALAGKVPYCPKCGAMVRPDVVMYGEQLDDSVVDSAVRAIEQADLLIIGGTSLAVYPAAGFVRRFRGERMVLINRQPTSYDGEASLIFRDKIGEVLSAAVKDVTSCE